MDLVTIGETVLQLSPSGEERLESTERLRAEAVGSASNVAIAARRVGAETGWISKLPDTPPGRRVAAAIRGHDVETDVTWSEGGRQGLEFRERTDALLGERRYPDRSGSPVRTLAPGEPSIDVTDATQLYTSGRTAVASPELTETTLSLFETAREAGTTTALSLTDHRVWEREAARQSIRELLSSVAVFFTTEPSVDRILGEETTGGVPSAKRAHALASKGDFETVLIARGDRGVTVWHDRTVFERECVDVDTVDERGVEDALFGVFLDGLNGGKSIEEALTAGLAAALLTRTAPRAIAPLTPQEVRSVAERLEE